MQLNAKRILVARMDGTAESGFAPGAIVATKDVPITLNFFTPIGMCDIEVDGTNVFAVIADDQALRGFFPALGVRSVLSEVGSKSTRCLSMVRHAIIHACEVVTVGLCEQPNVDPRIQRIA